MAMKPKQELVRKSVATRVAVVSAQESAPRVQNVEYTVLAQYHDGREHPVGTVPDFADVDSLKSHARMEASRSGAALKGFRVIERDYDSHRKHESGAPNHMQESEVQ